MDEVPTITYKDSPAVITLSIVEVADGWEVRERVDRDQLEDGDEVLLGRGFVFRDVKEGYGEYLRVGGDVPCFAAPGEFLVPKRVHLNDFLWASPQKIATMKVVERYERDRDWPELTYFYQIYAVRRWREAPGYVLLLSNWEGWVEFVVYESGVYRYVVPQRGGEL